MPYNVSSSGLYGIDNASSYMGSVGTITGIILIFIIGITLMLSYEPIMRRLLKFVAFLKKTFGYFFYGVSGSVVLGGLYLFVNMNIKQVQSGNPIFLKVVGWIILVYIGMTIFGWIIKRLVVDKIRRSYKKATKK